MIIYHTNDIHGHSEAMKVRLEEAHRRDGDFLWLDSGDSLKGSNTVFRWHEPILTDMTALGCRAMAMGNREFNYQRWVMRRRSAERGFPLLCVNLRDLRGYPPAWQESYTFDIPEGRITLYGATVVQYPVGSPWENVFGFRFLDPLDILPSLVREALERGEVPIILSHLGVDVDRRLAEKLPERTLILGGHTHTTLSEPVVVNGCWIVQSGAYAEHIGRISYDIAERNLLEYELIP